MIQRGWVLGALGLLECERALEINIEAMIKGMSEHRPR